MKAKKIGLQMLAEAGKTDLGRIQLHHEAHTVHDIMEMVRGIEKIPYNVTYSADMIPVIQYESNVYVVEFDNLQKVISHYKESTGFCNPEDAVRRIAEAHNIDMSSIAVLIESANEIKRSIMNIGMRIKQTEDPIKKNGLRLTLESFKENLRSLTENEALNIVISNNAVTLQESADEEEEWEYDEYWDDEEDEEYIEEE